MTARIVYQISYRWILGWLLLWLPLLVQATSANLTSIQPSAQCFSDASKAYAYLIHQTRQHRAEEAHLATNQVVNINTATESELVTLDGIGSSKAQAILLYREMFGKFHSIDDLASVKGIGKQTIEKNRHRLRVH
ncbi:ComEA family DNA-binding protein [Psychrobacter sp. I-STPA6b]|uniref:ComEA family DNA-binding protein n=1 Tax=Psychrobacter sp. I-STPA6b TaxID=2585718 RepID=UPI001D0C68B1|nr:ComEA family DNA-binding protein [Psychrobacter sp. I-STPA6b]